MQGSCHRTILYCPKFALWRLDVALSVWNSKLDIQLYACIKNNELPSHSIIDGVTGHSSGEIAAAYVTWPHGSYRGQKK